jgi:hypothetical protein
MPSFYDNTYHNVYRKPVYDREEDRITTQNKRLEDEIFERRLAPVPTQTQENEYMEFLAADLRSDPWITYRFRKYMAGPKRIPWKNSREIIKDHKRIFLLNWITGAVLFWPIACMIGRRSKRYTGGTPIVPYQRFINDFPNLEPARLSKVTFKWWSYGSMIIFGYVFAQATTDNRILINPWYNRTDLKPFAAMVVPDADDETTMRQVKL